MASGASQSQAADLLRRGIKFQEKGKLANALKAFDDSIAIDPGNPETYCHRGNAFADQGRPDLALANYQLAMMLAPQYPDAHDLHGVVLAQSGRVAEALPYFEKALSFDPNHLNALYNRALALKNLGRLDEALPAFAQVIARQPAIAAAHHDHGHVLAELGRHAEALASFDAAIQLAPDLVHARCNRATALTALGQIDAAIEAYREALSIDAKHVATLVNLADLLASRDESDAATPLYRRAVEQEPGHIEAWSALAAILSLRRRFDEAGRCYQEVLKLDLAKTDALHGLARALEELGRTSEQLTCYDHLIEIEPEAAQAHYRRGLVLGKLGRQKEALASLDRALEIDPTLPGAMSDRMHAAMFLSDWQGFDQNLEILSAKIEKGSGDVTPWALVTLKDDAALQLKCAGQFASRHYGSTRPHEFSGPYPDHERIRIGYFSSDFHHHATLQLLLETLEAHDLKRFEFSAFVFGQPVEDDWSRRANAALDHVVDVHLRSDQEVAALARELEIDIAIDLKGFTAGARAGIFAERAAPIQVSYLGYPGTSGMPTIDYLIADRVLIPEECRKFYSENIVYLPDSYQPNAGLKPLDSDMARSDAGLPQDAFVFCCFNRNYKITPAMFALWMRILHEVETGVLWLWIEDSYTRENLVAEARKRGIDEARLVFAEGMPNEKHLARLQLADLFLDTLPCNAHTTASDALKAGLPVLTCAGQSFASRGAASLLAALDLQEMIVKDFRSYESLAIDLAREPARLERISAALGRNRPTSSLFDPVHAARKLEKAYAAMYQRHLHGMAPADIFV